MSNGKAALQYAHNGWSVFPCASDKAPMTTGGFHAATQDYATIRNWWMVNPDALIGVAIPRGHLVIDIDPRNGGVLSWDEWQRLHDFPTDTLTATTGSGGTHYWYKFNPFLNVDELRTTVVRGVDLKRPGKGYVIVPPSVSDSGVYEWSNQTRMRHLTEAQTDSLRRATRLVPERFAGTATLEQGEQGTNYGKAALLHICERMRNAVNGQRNNTLYKEACEVSRLVAGNQLEEDYALTHLREAAEDAGLTYDEIMPTLESAYEAASAEPMVPNQLTVEEFLRR